MRLVALRRWGLPIGSVLLVSSSYLACSTPVRNFETGTSGNAGVGTAGDAGSPGAGAGGDTGGSAGSPPDMECRVGETQQCWEAEDGSALPPEPSVLQGSCHRGLRTCAAKGTFGACIGAVAPLAQDTCAAGADENCNGIANDGCSCTDGDSRACGKNVGTCKPGVQHCVGSTWGSCLGSVEPAVQDSCATIGDDADCDGVPNGGCPCIGAETGSCNDCGTRTCDAGSRTWGTCAATQAPAATRCASDGNGLQTCNAGGHWVTSACSTADINCTVACQASAAPAKCVVAAIDADGDSYGSLKCAAAPGNDCDDANPAVHPGASEICDGIDNDCDGAIDLHDGLMLSGTNTLVSGRQYLDLAWNPDAANFGWVANPTAGSGIFFGTLSALGSVTSAVNPLFTPTGTTGYFGQHIAYSAAFGGYGVVYSLGNQGGSFSNWLFVSSTGTAGGSYSLPTGQNASIATRQSNDFVIAHRSSAPGSLYFGTLPSSGNGYTNPVSLAESAILPRIATNGALSAIVYQINNTQTVNWVRVNASLVVSAPSQLTDTGKNPDITSVPSGYGIAWVTAAGLTFQTFSTAGSSVCGPTSVPFGDGTLDDQDAVALKSTQYGTVALAVDKGGHVGLFRFNATCALIDQQDIEPAATSGSAPSVAVGGGKLAISWTDLTPSAYNGYVRVFNEALCK